MSTYTIKGFSRSTCTLTVAMTILEAGASYEIDFVNILAGEQKAPEYVDRFQPFGQIPVLIDGDFHMFESRAIIRYVAAKHGAESLYPTALQKRAIVEQWLSANQSNNTPVTDIIVEFLFKRARGETPDESKLPEMTTKLNDYLSILDKQLSTRAYIAGDEFTLADISYMPFMHYLVGLPEFTGAFDGFENVNKWWKLISNRPTWKQVTTFN